MLSRAALVVSGMRRDGYREILSVQGGDTESFAPWDETFRSRKCRGLQRVMFPGSDCHGGLTEAIAKHFQGATWQRCQVHLVRNLPALSSAKYRPEVASAAARVLQAPDGQEADRHPAEFVERFGKTAPQAVKCLEEGLEDWRCRRNIGSGCAAPTGRSGLTAPVASGTPDDDKSPWNDDLRGAAARRGRDTDVPPERRLRPARLPSPRPSPVRGRGSDTGLLRDAFTVTRRLAAASGCDPHLPQRRAGLAPDGRPPGRTERGMAGTPVPRHGRGLREWAKTRDVARKGNYVLALTS